MEQTPQKCFRYGSEDHKIAKCPKSPKENEKWQQQVGFNEISNPTCDNRENNNDQNIYASMACMSDNDKFTSRNFCDSLQLTNCVLDSGATCQMTPEVSGFIPGSLENTDKHVEVADGHPVTEKKRVSRNKNV